MVFEGFQPGAATTRRKRPWVFGVSVILHGAALIAGVAYSFWHVDELKMPSLTVSFVSAVPQAAPPPPAAALGGGASEPPKKKVAKTKPVATPKDPTLVAPTERPKPVDPTPTDPEPPTEKPKPQGTEVKGPPGPGQADGVRGGDVNGVSGGQVNGVSGGDPHAPGMPAHPVRSKFLPPQLGGAQKLSGEDPEFPALLRRPGARYTVTAKICVNVNGQVETINILQGADPLLDSSVARSVKASWRFRPLLANGTAVPFCYNGNFAFRAD
jgi:outer membrane biosynthesis protein TonB